VLRERVSGIANLFDFIVNATRFGCMELEAGPWLYAVEDGLIEQLRAARLDGLCDVIHDLKGRSTCANKLDTLLLTSERERPVRSKSTYPFVPSQMAGRM
jgi:hypothetical protein